MPIFELHRRHLTTGDRDYIATYRTMKEAIQAQMDKERENVTSRFQYIVVQKESRK